MYPRREDNIVDLLALLADAMSSNSSQAIMNQEKRGQDTLSRSTTLPKDIRNGDKSLLESWGFVFGDDADDLFIYVTFPNGWKIEPTSHSMWSNLIDSEGKDRADIFYKAAFYDRDAFISISKE